jgi:hypothetical protein
MLIDKYEERCREFAIDRECAMDREDEGVESQGGWGCFIPRVRPEFSSPAEG